MNIHALFAKVNELDIDEREKGILKVIMNLAVRDYIRICAQNKEFPSEIVLDTGVDVKQTPTLSNLGIMIVPGIDDMGREVRHIHIPMELLNAWGKKATASFIHQ